MAILPVAVALLTALSSKPGIASNPVLTAQPPIPIEGASVTLTVDAGPNLAGSKTVLLVGNSLTPDRRFISASVPMRSGSTDVAGRWSTSFVVPKGSAGTRYYARVLGLHQGQLWQSNVPLITLHRPQPAWSVPADGNLGGVYQQAARGDVIEVRGTVPGTVGLRRSDQGAPIRIRAAAPGAGISMNLVGSSDSLALQNVNDTEVHALILEPDDRAGVLCSTGTPFRNVEFHQCWVGLPYALGWNAETNSGFQGKWGLLSYQLSNFLWEGGGIGGIGKEHAMYHHNPRARSPYADAITIRNATFRWCRRTAVQVTARNNEGPPGQGNVVIQDCTVEDVCLESGGGGHALSFHGNLDGTVLVDRVTVRMGANPDLDPSLGQNITGCLNMYIGGGAGGAGTRELIIRDCTFEVGPFFVGVGSARRASIDVGDVGRFSLLSTTILAHPGAREALNVRASTINRIILDDDNDVRGDCIFEGHGTFRDPNRDGSGYRALLKAVAADPKVTIR